MGSRRSRTATLAVALIATLALAGCRVPTKPPTPASPTSVVGPSSLTAAQIVAWFRASVPADAPYTATVPLETLVEMFLQEGDAENIRGDLAFVQSVVETRWFAYGNQVQWWQNNYSGIGACDSCSGGIAFPDARAGVRAQMQHLRNYADPGSRAIFLNSPPVRELYPTDARYDRFFKKGSAPDWTVMGNGNWASSPTYATTVLTRYNALRTFNGLAPV
jgi:hypothetical protein